MPAPETEADQAAVVAFLAEGAKRIDTSTGIVFLKGEEAIKLRRAIRLPFLDHTTLAKRRASAEAEIARNHETAPGIYLEAAAVRKTAAGYALEGEGEIVDWVTRMRRFDEEATLDKVAARGELTDAHIRGLGAAIHAMHARAPTRPAAPAIAAMGRWIEQNATAFAERPDLFPAHEAAELQTLAQAALATATPLLLARGERGRIRRGHGDLHLGNIALIEGRATPFDAIEFDDEIATGDILYDLAFAAMDLWERDRRAQSNLLLNVYLSLGETQDYAALALLPLFLSVRAAIRVKVEAGNLGHLDAAKREAAARSARRYFDFALAFLKPAPPRLVAVGGLSGAGKSALAAALAPELGAAPGAVWLRSDVERKHLFGVDELTRLGDEAYAAEASRRVHARLAERAQAALKAGHAVLVDATHAHAAERRAVAALAGGAPFAGLWLEAPVATRIQRIRARRGDASDADEAVARAQASEAISEPGWRAIDASGDLAATQAAAREAL
jgi:aminoglycoside phosphotransferase family enzyme/predicted kinase